MSAPTVDPRATTPTFGWRVPVLSSPPNVPADLTNLGLDIEATVGRDTGWRNVAATYINGWTGSLKIRRVASEVTVVVETSHTSGSPVLKLTGLAPVGFDPMDGGALSPTWSWQTGKLNPMSLMASGPGFTNWLSVLVETTYTAGTVLDGTLHYTTAQAWPTTLPGTPA